VLAGAALFFFRNRRLRLAIAAVVVAGEALLLFVVPMASAPRRVHLDLAPVSFLQRQLGYSRFFTLSPLQPNYGSYFGIGALNVNDIPIPKPFARYVNARLDRVVDPTLFVGDYGGARPKTEPSPKEELLRNLDGYRAAAVAYVLTPSGQALPQSADTFTLVFRSPSTWIYRLAGAAPYVQAPGCRVTVRSRNDIGLSCRRRTSLVRRETDLPGWSASVDGHHARVQPFDGLFQSIAVGAGAHRITFSYRPPYVDWGYAAFAIGLGWLALVLVLEPVVRRRRVNRALR
jgi:hypothetical protein